MNESTSPEREATLKTGPDQAQEAQVSWLCPLRRGALFFVEMVSYVRLFSHHMISNHMEQLLARVLLYLPPCTRLLLGLAGGS